MDAQLNQVLSSAKTLNDTKNSATVTAVPDAFSVK